MSASSKEDRDEVFFKLVPVQRTQYNNRHSMPQPNHLHHKADLLVWNCCKTSSSSAIIQRSMWLFRKTAMIILDGLLHIEITTVDSTKVKVLWACCLSASPEHVFPERVLPERVSWACVAWARCLSASPERVAWARRLSASPERVLPEPISWVCVAWARVEELWDDHYFWPG